MSPKTASYVEALIREGDDFDYARWLDCVSTPAAQANEATVAAGTPHPPSALDCRTTLPNSHRFQRVLVGWRLGRSPQDPNGATPKARLERRLKKIQKSWDELQATRARDAVYGYLACVFSIVAHYKVRRKSNKLLRVAFEFADLPIDRSADPFATVIRCTSDDTVDSKTISKWARALRYVAHCKPPKMRVETFMKRIGGINACAELYARYFGWRLDGRRPVRQGPG